MARERKAHAAIGPNLLERHDGEETIHLPHDHGATASFHTLCGLCDMPGSIEDTMRPVDCETCMHVLAHCLALAAHRGVIRSMPRESTLSRARRGAP